MELVSPAKKRVVVEPYQKGGRLVESAMYGREAPKGLS